MGRLLCERELSDSGHFLPARKILVVWGLFAENRNLDIFLGSFRAGSNLGHAGILFARVCPDGRADGQ